VGGYLVVALTAMYVVGAPEWGLLWGVLWLPWVGLYVWYRGRRQPWWRNWMYAAFGIYGLFVAYWLQELTPYWAWVIPIAFLSTTLFEFYDEGTDGGFDLALIHRKSCWLLPWGLLPFLAYMTALYCLVG
jgi:hypothetical protein